MQACADRGLGKGRGDSADGGAQGKATIAPATVLLIILLWVGRIGSFALLIFTDPVLSYETLIETATGAGALVRAVAIVDDEQKDLAEPLPG